MRIPLPTYFEAEEKREIESRMKAKTTIDSITGCWLFEPIRKRGYAHVKIRGSNQDVHRVSAALYLGYDLFDHIHQVNHKCSNKNCWNPDHLYIGTQQDNVQDSIINGTHVNINKTNCVNGHEFTEKNTYITSNGVRQCRACKAIRERERRERRL